MSETRRTQGRECERSPRERKPRTKAKRKQLYFISLVPSTNPLALNSVTTHVGVLGAGCIPPTWLNELRLEPPDEAEVKLVTEGARERRPEPVKAGKANGDPPAAGVVVFRPRSLFGGAGAGKVGVWVVTGDVVVLMLARGD